MTGSATFVPVVLLVIAENCAEHSPLKPEGEKLICYKHRQRKEFSDGAGSASDEMKLISTQKLEGDKFNCTLYNCERCLG